MAEVALELSPLALDMLEETYQFIRTGHNGLERVRKFNIEIVNSFSLLKSNPKMGVKFKRYYRYIFVGKYRFTYHFYEEKQLIWIVSVYHIKSQQFKRDNNLRLPE